MSMSMILALALTPIVVSAQSAATKQLLTDWQVTLDGGKTFTNVTVPGTIENQIDPDFDGLARYQTQLPPVSLKSGERLFLRFQAVATHAKVYLNEQPIGEHLGGWTPFEIDVTHAWPHGDSPQPQILRVDVDERVGHNTQGFLPIITNHFGGIWQPVELQIRQAAVIDRDSVQIVANLKEQEINVTLQAAALEDTTDHFRLWMRSLAPVSAATNQPAPSPNSPPKTTTKARPSDTEGWVELALSKSEIQMGTPLQFPTDNPAGDSTPWIGRTIRLACKSPEVPLLPWSPDSPQRYEFRIDYRSSPPTSSQSAEDSQPDATDSVSLITGFRDFQTAGSGFLLNGKRVSLRGVLNWGYAPPSYAPSLDEAFMRSEIEFAQARGFNMMKFCLWMPPKRYFELCDELGMFAWVEYPTWHPQLDQQHLAELKQEYQEFFEYDRNHPAVVLRSLTCETGPSADIEVIRALYAQCKAAVPGAIVVDDSSWISWNRVHDFYDDHPYGNNHTWVDTLGKLTDYIAQREEQPLVLGEAIAADTWTVSDSELQQLTQEHPAHAPWSLNAGLVWIDELQDLAISRQRIFNPQLLLPQSVHYGQLMRKYQIETYRREVPSGGYVVSVIRDFPKAAMGLVDFHNQPKHTPSEWHFQRDTMLLLRTNEDRRSFEAGRPMAWEVGLATPHNLTDPAAAITFNVELLDVQGVSQGRTSQTQTAEGAAPHWTKLNIALPAVTQPQRMIVRAQATSGSLEAANEWPIWIFPTPAAQPPAVHAHTSAVELARDLQLLAKPWSPITSPPESTTPILTRKLDSDLLEALRQGARVIMIPDGSTGSFPLSQHWFLRGAPVVLPRADDNWHAPISLRSNDQTTEQNMLIELQHFDLAGPVVPRIDRFWPLIDPLLILWDNHDIREVHTHGLVFEMEVGNAGRLFVTSLNHVGQENAAGRWLLHRWIEQLSAQKIPQRFDVDARETILARLTSELGRQTIPLHADPWKFLPDREQHGHTEGWFHPDWNDAEWDSIRVDAHWDGQGYGDLDKWGWYRTRVTLPEDWHSPRTYLNFTGIDDYADIYVNGQKVGTAGNIETKTTAFEERVSLDITPFVQDARELQITVAVYDWYGAGGIFRPVTLSTTPLNQDPPILK